MKEMTMAESLNPENFEPPYEETPAPLIRKVIAGRLLESKLTIPHFYLFDEVDMGEVVSLRLELNEDTDQDRDRNAEPGGVGKISFNDIIVKAVAVGLERHPECNVSYRDGKIRRFREININIAVAIEDGLLVPVLRGCGGKSLFEISRESKAIVEKARTKKLRPREGMGGTITVSNLGVFGLDGSFSIINPPQAMIFTTGAIKEVPVVEEGELAVGTRMKVTLSCDHRAVDGAVGAAFLAEVKKILENPRGHVV
jgi:pyruvate dehydrogenase E2 component (dihydrolipoamide acetyltransferase)